MRLVLALRERPRGNGGCAMPEKVDVVVLGMGPGGEVAASRLLAGGKRVAVVERELIGGECAYWACVPSKTLLRPVEARAEAGRVAGVAPPALRWPEIAAYRDYMTRHLDDQAQVRGYQKQGALVVRGAGRLAGPGQVEVDGRRIEAEHVIVATGSDPVRPSIPGLDQVTVWTNREATQLREVPGRAVVVGGGPVGLELGQLLARLGSRVTLVQHADRLINREDPRVGELGLEAVGVSAAGRGLPVDDHCRVAGADGLWAVGDASGVALFTHIAKYQGRIVADNLLGRARRASYQGVPRVVFSDPELAAVGLTEAQARQAGHDVATATVSLPDALARPWTYQRDPGGDLGLVADRRRRVLLGAWSVAPLAGEWVHQIALAVRAELTIDVLVDQVAQFPTWSEGFLTALEQLQVA